MDKRCVSGVLLLSFALAASACSPRNEPQVPSVAAQPPKPNDAHTTTLVVKKEIVRSCSALTKLHDGVTTVPPDAVWIAILDGLADCMQNGDLRGRSVLLRGAPPARALVAYVLTARGVAPARLAVGASRDDGVEISLVDPSIATIAVSSGP